MNRRWICSDVWMDILPSFDHAQLGLKMALISDRFDILVDAHFDGKSELTIWRKIRIFKDKGRNANNNGPKVNLSVWIDDNDIALEELPIVPLHFGDKFVKFPIVLAHGNFVEFSMPNRPLHNKIRFHYLYIDYLDHSVLTFLRSNKQIWDRNGTKLLLSFDDENTEDNQRIWDIFTSAIWPLFTTNIRQLGFTSGDALDNLRRRTSPTILTDLDQLNAINSGVLLPDMIADDGPNATAGQVLSKWLHTPSKNGQPKRLHRNGYWGPPNLEWVNNFKETFRRATTSVSYQIQFYFPVGTMQIEQFELVNEVTNEKVTLKQNTEVVYNWLLKRCPIGETAKAALNWEDSENSCANANLNSIRFELWNFDKSIGPLSPPAEEEEEADKSNENVV